MNQEEQEAYQALKQENERLASELAIVKGTQEQEQIKQTKERETRRKWLYWGIGSISTFVLGKGAKTSFEQIGTDLDAGKIPDYKTLTVTGYHILWRFVRVTAFAWLATIATVVFIGFEVWLLFNQTMLLQNQNELAENQNKLVAQQNALSEASRRSSLVLLMSNIEDRIAEELRVPNNKDRELSEALIGRIIALCNSMKPYKYLEDDTLSKLSSPERGQLLVSLLSSRLSVTSYDMIFDRANFDYCDVPEVNFRGISLVGVNMSYSNISFADLRECNLSYSRMKGSDLAGSDLRKSTLNSTDFYRADLFATNFRGANLAGASFREANLKKTDLRNTNLLGLKISSLDAFTEVVDFPKDKFEIDTTKLKDYQGTYFLVKEKKK